MNGRSLALLFLPTKKSAVFAAAAERGSKEGGSDSFLEFRLRLMTIAANAECRSLRLTCDKTITWGFDNGPLGLLIRRRKANSCVIWVRDHP